MNGSRARKTSMVPDALPWKFTSQHFAGLNTTWMSNGLHFDDLITPSDREMCLTDVEEIDPRWADRPSTRVIANPTTLSPEELITKLRRAQRALPREPINVSYLRLNACAKKGDYDRQWCPIDGSAEGPHEEQGLVLVAFHKSAPVGYISLDFGAVWYADTRCTSLRVEPHMVYVAPRFRGYGFGADLSIAAGLICEDFVQAVYRAVPSRTNIEGIIEGDFESRGGERIYQHLLGCLDCAVDRIRDDGRRQSVNVARFDSDCGY